MRATAKARSVLVPMLAAGGLLSLAAGGAIGLNFEEIKVTLKLNGDADFVGKRIRVVPAEGNQTGSAFTKHKVIDPRRSFSAHFRFDLHGAPGNHGDGLVFVLQPGSKRALGDGGGGLGFNDIGTPSLGVEFDIFENGEWNDPDDNHVAITRDGDPGNHIDSATPNFDLYDEGKIRVWIVYNAGKRKLKVFVNDAKAKPDEPLVALKKKLRKILGGDVRAGFTAATGAATAHMDILHWTLQQRG